MQNITIQNCSVGITSPTGTSSKTNQLVNSLTAFDFQVIDTPILFNISTSAGNFVFESINTTNVPSLITQNFQNILTGSSSTTNVLAGWSQGSIFTDTSTTPVVTQDAAVHPTRPSSLVGNDGYYFGRSRPLYETATTDEIVSVRSSGARGDGLTDDTQALQTILDQYASTKIIFFDHGIYVISSTLNIPLGARLVGEVYSMILGSGSNFHDSSNPQPVVRVGQTGQSGVVEISDMLFSARGPAAGAIIIEWNIAGSSQGSASMFDSHIIIGGFQGSK